MLSLFNSQNIFIFVSQYYYCMFGKLVMLLFYLRMYVGGECTPFPKISVLFTQKPRFLEAYILFSSLCNDNYKCYWMCCVYLGLIFFYRFIVTYIILKEKPLNLRNFSIKPWPEPKIKLYIDLYPSKEHLYISEHRCLIHLMEGCYQSSLAGSLQCPVFAGLQSSET